MVVLRGDLSSTEWASLCRREAGRRGRKESVQGTMERGKPFLSFHHPPCAYYSFVILFLMEYPVRAQGCHEAGVEISLATMYVALKNCTRKIELKETPTCLISRPLVVFTRQLEILVTALGRLFRGESKVREICKGNCEASYNNLLLNFERVQGF